MSGINLLAIPVAAVAAFLIGGLWYSPLLFAKAWVAAHGHSPEKLAAMQANAGRTYGLSFVAFLLMATVLSIFLKYLHVHTLQQGAGWGFHAWLGFALPLGFIAQVYSDKKFATFLIDSGYQLVYLTVMGAILGAWQ
jgi:Protein of unknown function (DUF1761)